jgi:hypothetical protein
MLQVTRGKREKFTVDPLSTRTERRATRPTRWSSPTPSTTSPTTRTEFDAVHLSPPCQWYTRGNAKDRGKATKWERSIPTAREAVLATGLPYVIENVKDAGWDMLDPSPSAAACSTCRPSTPTASASTSSGPGCSRPTGD